MKKLLQLEQELIKAKEELSKIMSSSTTVPGSVNSTGGPSIGSQIGFGKKEEDHEDEEEDKKLVAEALDQHNEKKHGEKKSKDSAKKDMGLKKSEETLISFPNRESTLTKSKKDSEKTSMEDGAVLTSSSGSKGRARVRTDDGSILSEPQHRGASGKGRIRMDSIRAKTGNPEEMMIRAEEQAEKAGSKSEDSAKKDMGLKKKEVIKSLPNGQWSIGDSL